MHKNKEIVLCALQREDGQNFWFQFRSYCVRLCSLAPGQSNNPRSWGCLATSRVDIPVISLNSAHAVWWRPFTVLLTRSLEMQESGCAHLDNLRITNQIRLWSPMFAQKKKKLGENYRRLFFLQQQNLLLKLVLTFTLPLFKERLTGFKVNLFHPLFMLLSCFTCLPIE